MTELQMGLIGLGVAAVFGVFGYNKWQEMRQRKVAEAVLMLSTLDDPPLRLLLGRDVLAAVREKIADLTASIDQWESVTKDVNFPKG